ncbi:hypothetical protein GGR58DRAFT_450334 [Xylaria digitata]|nr:hypothetical protein GGR58DRAFT_450334 [Xylaria digitata]
MASLINVDAPGAYPVTPSNEEPLQQTQPSSHNFTDSRIPLEESSRTRGTDFTSSRRDPPQSTQSNKETPRSSSNDDAHFSGHHSKDSGIYVDDSSFNREGLSESNNAQPGVMTGAYSRVGGRESAFTEGVNYTHHNTSTTQSPRDKGLLSQYDNEKAPNTPTDISVPTNTPIGTQNLDSNTTTTNVGGHTDKGSNKVRGGLREKSHIEHNDPYWGNIPFGAGVYNGVTGHGSNESTAHRKSSNNTDSTTTTSSGVYNGVTGHGSKSTTQKSAPDNVYDAGGINHGIYNGVTGHGSKESANHRVSGYDQYTATNDLPSQQRAFPLDNNADTTVVNKASDADTRNNDSHFKEIFAGAGATAAGGYAAHKYHSKDSEKEAKAADDKLKDEKPSQTKSHTFVNSQGHKSKEAAPVTNVAENRTLEREPLDTIDEGKTKENSNLGYYGAAATGAGAGAYGIHKYANRDQAREQVPEDEVEPSITSRNAVRESTRNEPATAGLHGLRKPSNREGQLLVPEDESATSDRDILGSQPIIAGTHGLRKHPKRDDTKDESSALSDETSTPHGLSELNQAEPQNTAIDKSDESASRGQPQYNVLAGGIPSGISDSQPKINNRSIPLRHKDNMFIGNSTGGTRDTERSSSDSSHGGQYNVLSSGTPSGINLEQAHI